jgi:hypothetical protein
LPSSLKVLKADKETLKQFDFEPLKNLTELMVFNGEARKEEFINLTHEVVFKSM